MADIEIIELRGRNHKVYDIGDNKKKLVTNIAPIHHLKNGIWTDTDCGWKDLTDRFGVGEYPFLVSFHKQTRTVSITHEGTTVTLTPTNTRNPTISRVDNILTLNGLWRGITLVLALTYDGIKATYIRTSDNFVNPSYTFTGNYLS